MTGIVTPAVVLFCVLFDVVVLYLTIRAWAAGAPRSRSTGASPLPPVSIVIPFKDEAHNLPDLLSSFARQYYPAGFELVLVNDRSTDAFRPLLEAFQNVNPHIPLRLVDSHYDPSIRLTSKQQALEKGVDHASHDWLVFTDADMQFSPDWLSTLMSGAAEQETLIYGHTALRTRKRSLFQHLQGFQLEFLFATAYAFHHSGIPGSCMGNNLALPKRLYEQIGGQRGIGYSIVEDRDLFYAVLKAGCRPVPTEPFAAHAFSYPVERFGSFLQQALRWAKGGLQGRLALQPFILLFGLQNVLLPVAALGLLSAAATWSVAASLLALFVFVAATFRRIGSRQSLLLFPLFLLFLMVQTILVTGNLLLRRPVRWKDRRI
jgi:cellulose synthase/poly-beta-1,6-N-acetylglucosamine synthase-like glycosyltransferase